MRAFFAAAAILAASPLTSTITTAASPSQGGVDFRAGGFFPAGSSGFWDEQERRYTLDHSDFNGFTGSIGYVGSVNNYIEFDIDGSVYASEERSSSRRFVDTNGNLIFHDTRLFTLPVTVSFRVLPAGRFARRGAEGQHYVRRPVPYIGAGVGMAYWQYEEEGDFVFDTIAGPIVDYDRVQDTGLELETHVKAGIEFPIAPAWNLTLEVRRSWAEATLEGGFPSMAQEAPTDGPVSRDLDLGGVSVLFGASMRF